MLRLFQAGMIAAPMQGLKRLIYLLTALGVALTRHRLVDLAADRVRHASGLMNHSDPDRAANTLMVSLWCGANAQAAALKQ
jgi:hypothetical protein